MQPATYLFDFEHTDDKTRPYIMQEFARNGARHLVLTDTLIRQIMFDSDLVQKLRKNLADTGMDFVDSHAPFNNWNDDLDLVDTAMRPTMIARKKVAMHIAADFGVDTITIHVGNALLATRNQGHTIQECDENIKRALEELLPLAEQLKMVICIENIWAPTNTTDKLLALIDFFQSENLGICYDAGHANLMKAPQEGKNSAPIEYFGAFDDFNDKPVPYDPQMLEHLLPHVVNCHLHDNNGLFDFHRLPGTGTVDWPHIIGLLKKAPRLRSFQSEVIPVRENVSIRTLVETFEALLK